MKKTFGILGTGLLLFSNALMSFGNVSFAVSCGEWEYTELETNGCYVLKHHYHDYQCTSHYEGSDLLAYKCDAEGGTVDLRDLPFGSGYYIKSIGEDAFLGTNVTKVVLPSTVKNIGDGAFCDAERVGDPVCGNEIIESGEECDDGSNGSHFCTTECNKTLRGNNLINEGEDCFTCPEDIEANGGYCGKSLGEGNLDEESLESLELQNEPESTINLAMAKERGDWAIFDFGFVEISFPDGMNSGLSLDSIDSACAEMQEYKVTFKTESGEVLRELGTSYQHIDPYYVPSFPDKEGFTGGWYLGDELFSLDSHITENITLVYKYMKQGVDYDETNGEIRVSLGDQEIIVKDRNQGAKRSFREVARYLNFQDYNNDLWDLYYDGEITEEEKNTLLLAWVNENVGSFSSLTEFYNYLDDFQQDASSIIIDTVGNYYFWGNNVGVNARYALFNEETQRIDYSKLENLEFPEGFDHGYIGLTGGNDWTVGSTDTPCNADSGEYLPTPDDWKLLMQMWGKINGYTLNYDEYNDRYWFDDPNFSNKAAIDFGIVGLPAAYVNQNQVDFDQNYIYQGSLDNGKIGYMTRDGIQFLNTSHLSGNENNIAMPVRCFIKSSKKEAKPETHTSGSSGGGGRGSISKTSETSDEVHNSAENKTDFNSEDIKNNDKNDTTNDSQKQSGEEPQKKVTYVPNKNLSEMENAYSFSHSYGITTKKSIENAKMNSPLTRIQMAKMLSNYAMNVLGKQPDVSKGVVRFKDVTNKMNKDYDNGVTLAYQLGIMGINMKNNNFRPNDEVTRAEFVTALSRLLYGTSDGGYKSTSKYYEPHMAKLYNEGIISKKDPTMKEKRGYVMLMLMRSAK